MGNVDDREDRDGGSPEWDDESGEEYLIFADPDVINYGLLEDLETWADAHGQ